MKKYPSCKELTSKMAPNVFSIFTFLPLFMLMYFGGLYSGWVVTWFLLGYTVRKNGGLLSTPMF